MLTGAVEVYANHAVVIVGSTAWPPEVEWGDEPAGADARHVAIRTRGQVALTRVSFWSRTMPLVGEVVFDGELDLDDYTIFVGDIERLGRWTQRIERTGVQRIVVRVDDPGNASRVHVGLGLDLAADVRSLPAVTGHPLPDVLTSEPEDMSRPGQRGLILDGHDSPHARLAAAVMLISDPDSDQPWLEAYEVKLIVEWLRWLGADLSLRRATELGANLHHAICSGRSLHGGLTPEDADRIAKTILEQVDQGGRL